MRSGGRICDARQQATTGEAPERREIKTVLVGVAGKLSRDRPVHAGLPGSQYSSSGDNSITRPTPLDFSRVSSGDMGAAGRPLIPERCRGREATVPTDTVAGQALQTTGAVSSQHLFKAQCLKTLIENSPGAARKRPGTNAQGVRGLVTHSKSPGEVVLSKARSPGAQNKPSKRPSQIKSGENSNIS